MLRDFLKIALTCSFVALAGGCASEASFDETQARAALTHAKVETWRALYRDNNVDDLNAFLADDFTLIGPDGTTTSKSAVLADLRDNPWNMPEDFIYTVDDIIFMSQKSALVYGQGNSTRTAPDGTACHHTYTSSNAFRFEGGHWRPVSSHVSGGTCTPINE